jgi:hypothetical protein
MTRPPRSATPPKKVTIDDGVVIMTTPTPQVNEQVVVTILATRVCFTWCSCATAVCRWPSQPERPRCAVHLMTATAFFCQCFVHRVDATNGTRLSDAIAMSGQGAPATRHRPAVDFAAIGSGDTIEVGHCGMARSRGGGSLCSGNAFLLAEIEKARLGAGGLAMRALEPLRPIVR